MPNSAKPGLRERKKARTRAAIEHHALKLFREQGYDATTIEQIIDAAEVSESTFFRYFPTKEAVVLSDDLDPLIIAAYRAQPADLPPVAALRAAFREVFGASSGEQRDEMRERIALVLSVPALRAAMLDQFSEAMRLLADAIAERAGRPADDFAIRILAGAVVGIMIAVAEVLTDDPTADLADLIDQGIARLETGLRL
ncbi:MAG TPA: TetR family transcriptional regulator [Pseudonocardiaceae bacterium]